MPVDISTQFLLELKWYLKCNTFGYYFLYTVVMRRSCREENKAAHHVCEHGSKIQVKCIRVIMS